MGFRFIDVSEKIVARSLRPTTASTDPRSYLISSLTTEIAFATFPCGARGRREKGRVCPDPGRGQTSCTISVGNILFTLFILNFF